MYFCNRAVTLAWISILTGFVPGCATIRKLNPIQSSLAESRQLTQQAEADIHDARWREAELKLARAVEKCPEDGHARQCLANVLWQRGATRAAAAQMARSIELSPSPDPDALTQLGQMELSLGDTESAGQRANAALQLDKMSAEAWTLQANTLRAQGRIQEALKAYYRSLSLHSDNADTRLAIAGIYRQRGEAARGLARLAAIPASDSPESIPVYVLRGQLLRELGRPGDAALAFEQAYQRGDSRPETLFQLAEAQLAAGNVAQVQETLEQAKGVVDADSQPLFAELQRRVHVATQSGWAYAPLIFKANQRPRSNRQNR